MMTAICSYSAGVTKMRAMYRGVLRNSQYETMLHMGHIREIMQYLGEMPGYRQAVQDISDAAAQHNAYRDTFRNTDRVVLERALSGVLMQDAEKLSHMLPRNGRAVLETFLRRREVDVLKRMLRALYTGQPLPSRELAFGCPPTLYACLQATTFLQLLDALTGSGYDRVLEPYILRSEIRSTFDMEYALDVAYCRRLQASATEHLSRRDAGAVLDFLRTEIDARNMMWAYRYKKYYYFTPDDVLNHLIPNRGRLRRNQLQQIAKCELPDFGKIVAQTHYGSLFCGDNDGIWDKQVAHFLYRLYKKQLQGNRYSFASLLAYLFIREIDIQNIITIVEGVRCGMEPERIRKYIVAGDMHGD